MMERENFHRILHGRYLVCALPSPTAGLEHMRVVGCRNSHAARRARRSLKRFFPVVWTRETTEVRS